MRIWAICGWIAATGALLACGGCGFKGPLYLPERNPTVVTHPRQAAQPAAPATQGAPSSGPTQTLAGKNAAKNKGKSAPPASSPPAPAPQSKPKGFFGKIRDMLK